MNQENFEQDLRKYAEVLVRIGVNITEGDLLHLTVSVSDDPNIRKLAHYVIEAAYEAGAKYVDLEWRDAEANRLRILHSAEDNLDYVPEWTIKKVESFADAGAARLVISGSDPALFAGLDRQKVTTMQRAGQMAMAHLIPKLIDVNVWCGSAVPVQAWAEKVFPDLPADEQMAKLWDAIFAATRIYEDDPVAAWEAHQENLIARRQYMNDKQYTALHFTGEGTDLTVGLPQGHRWAGGGSEHGTGKLFTPNIPTDEIFTMPHRERVNGTVKATKPLSYNGSIIEDFSFTFEDGRVKDFSAAEGADVIQDILDTDEGAKYLGEVALVPHSAPISSTGILFLNTLYDENAACHIALGRAYAKSIEGGVDMSPDEFMEAGGNSSRTHVDFMIGNADVNIDGVTMNGEREPIFRNGEWAFEV